MAPPSSDTQLSLADVQDQLGSMYERFDSASRTLHLELLSRIREPADVALDVRPVDTDRSMLVICTVDAIGTLSIIAGLCTAFGIDIVVADVFTVTVPAKEAADHPTVFRRPRRRPVTPTPTRGRILDIFEVQTNGQAGDTFWDSFEHDLAGLIHLVASGHADMARDHLIDRVSEALRVSRSDEGPLFPVHIEVDNEAAADSTVLRIRSVDAIGFLFEFTNALALLSVNIERAEIRTVAGATRDTFWVTEARGGKIVTQTRVEQLRVAAALIKQFTLLLPRSPNPAQALRQFSALTRQLLTRPDWTAALRDLESGAVLQTLAELMGVSEFLWEDFLRMQHENLFPVLGDVPGLDVQHTAEELRAALQALLAPAHHEEERRRVLNEFKDREMFRIDLRHITGRTEFSAFADELSSLAEVVMDAAMSLAQEPLTGRYGRPHTTDGQLCDWVACALGKFGGRELGFASDIEMLFVYGGEGETDGPEHVANARYFEECVRGLLHIVAARHEGIFEIDPRLRPHGDAGPLAITEDGFRGYYADGGDAEQFERMALVKLRPVAGSPAIGVRLVQARDAFVYSGRSLDIANILHLRHRQATELVPPGEISAKYSPGGVVDIEYFVQARQIEAGANDPSVRVTGTRNAIEQLVKGGHVEAALGRRLTEAYSFLRRLIDGLRVVRGHARDLTIPPRDSQEFAYLARRMRYESADALIEAIDTHMAFARGLWEDARTAQTA